MKFKFIILPVICLAFIGCSKEDVTSNDLKLGAENSVAAKAALSKKPGATQISGIGVYAEVSECDYEEMGATYAIQFTGDLEGCFYVFVDEYDCSPSGTYRETGREYFVGTLNGEAGTFWTAYRFEGKFEGCAEDGSYIGAEIFGRCQHPLVEGSGDGVFEGVTGRLDMKDDMEAGNFPYRGHFKS